MMPIIRERFRLDKGIGFLFFMERSALRKTRRSYTQLVEIIVIAVIIPKGPISTQLKDGKATRTTIIPMKKGDQLDALPNPLINAIVCLMRRLGFF